RLRLVEVDHRRPRALAAVALHFLPIGLVDVEEVGVALELLPRVVALALQSLAVARLQPEQPGDREVGLEHARVRSLHVAALARAIAAETLRVEKARRGARGTHQ